MLLNATIFNKYIAAGVQLLPIKPNSKVAGKMWKGRDDWDFSTNKFKSLGDIGDYAILETYQSGCNFAYPVAYGYLVIDVDMKQGIEGLESLLKLERDCKLTFTKTVQTPSGGFHCYCKLPSDFEGHISQKDSRYPSIDFQTFGYYVLVGGSVINDKHYDLLTENVDFQDLEGEFYFSENFPKLIENNDTDDLLHMVMQEQSKALDKDYVIRMINYLDPDTDRNSWLNVGMALHFADPENERGFFDIWDEWSAKATQKGRYPGTKELSSQWHSFKLTKNSPVTFGTVEYMVRSVLSENGGLDKIFTDIDTKINDNNSSKLSVTEITQLRDEFTMRLLDISDDPFNIGLLATKLVKLISPSVIVSKKEITDFIKKERRIRKQTQSYLSDEIKNIGDISPYIFIVSTNKFYRPDLISDGNMIPLSPDALELHLSPLIAKELCESEKRVAYCVRTKQIMTFLGTTFVPSRTAPMIFKVKSLDSNKPDELYFNTYNRYNIPKPAKVITPAGKQAFEMFKLLFVETFGDSNDAMDLLYFYAWHLQNIGKRKTICPLIIGGQGSGKSTIINLVAKMFGEKYSYGMKNSDVGNKFNSFILDKLFIHNQEFNNKKGAFGEVYDWLKNNISDKAISIEGKNKDSITGNNHALFTLASNDSSFKLDHDDRRMWCLQALVGTPSNLARIEFNRNVPTVTLAGTEQKVSFYAYFDTILNHSQHLLSELLAQMLELTIPYHISSMVKAPETSLREQLLETSSFSSNETGKLFIRFINNNPSKLFNNKLVNAKAAREEFITNLMLFENKADAAKRVTLRHCQDWLKLSNYIYCNQPYPIGDDTIRFFIHKDVWNGKNNPSKSEILSLLNTSNNIADISADDL